MDKFNFKNFLVENRLGSFGKFNSYVDLNPINEEETPGKNITVNDFFTWYAGDANWASDPDTITTSMTIDGKWADDLGGAEKVVAFLTKHKDDVLQDYDESQYADNNVFESPYEISFKIDGKNIEIYDVTNKYGETDLDEAEQNMDLPKKPEKIYANNTDWMNDDINGERYGDWVASWDELPGIVVWTHNQLPTEQLYVAITPGWDGPGTPMETIFNAGDDTGEYDSIEEFEFSSFQEYLNAVKFYLDKVDDNIHNGKYMKYGITLDKDTANDKVYEMGSETLSQEEAGANPHDTVMALATNASDKKYDLKEEAEGGYEKYLEAQNDFVSDPEVRSAIDKLKAKCKEYLGANMGDMSDEEYSAFLDELYGYQKDNDPDDMTIFDVLFYQV